MINAEDEKQGEYKHYLAKARELGISDACADGIARYIAYRIKPGSFLTAVLENDLVGAFGRADDHNIKILDRYARFLYWDIPSPAWGSPEKVKAWLERDGDE